VNEYKISHFIFQLKNGLGVAATYYVYNDLEDKCFVLPPSAADGLTDKTYTGAEGALMRFQLSITHYYHSYFFILLEIFAFTNGAFVLLVVLYIYIQFYSLLGQYIYIFYAFLHMRKALL